MGVLPALVVPLTAFGGTSSRISAADATTQREADLYLIDQIEVKFHQATSTHNLNLMMSLWAPGAVFNIDQADADRQGADQALVRDREHGVHAG